MDNTLFPSTIATLLLVALPILASAGNITKCVMDDGRIVYTDAGCGGNVESSEAVRVDKPPSTRYTFPIPDRTYAQPRQSGDGAVLLRDTRELRRPTGTPISPVVPVTPPAYDGEPDRPYPGVRVSRMILAMRGLPQTLTLDDQSAWKVHREDINAVTRWRIQDKVSVRLAPQPIDPDKQSNLSRALSEASKGYDSFLLSEESGERVRVRFMGMKHRPDW